MSLTLPPPWTLWIDLAARWLGFAVVAIWAVAQGLVVLYAYHRYATLWRWWRRPRRPSRPLPSPPSWPRVTVQLPIFNERRVVVRLIDAVAALRYPRRRLEIQVLDDSTDETLDLARRAAGRHRARGIDVRVLHRARRQGYKAGALAAGLERARGEIVVVFDADFVPHPDFLERILPHFADPRVGMVQGRWGHLNRRRSLLTAAQGAMLDSHFLLEHHVRMVRGLFFNFSGTAGAWRRSCIESAGGWQQDTLTEDLDLSYRAQLAGWRFVFDPAIETPGELPPDLESLKSQQRRWAKGSVQTARKLLPLVLRGSLPGRVKLEAFVHLTSNFAYPLTLVAGILMLPVMLIRFGAPSPIVGLIETGLLVFGVIPAVLYLFAGQAARGATISRGLADVLAALVLAAGLTVNNTRAVLEGFGARLGEWERTPKTGDGTPAPMASVYAGPGRPAGGTELALAVYFLGVVAMAWEGGHRRVLPFALLLLIGLGAVGLGSRWPCATGPRGSR